MTEHREATGAASPRAREHHAARRVGSRRGPARLVTPALSAVLLIAVLGCGAMTDEAAVRGTDKAELKDAGWAAAEATADADPIPTPDQEATPDVHSAQRSAKAFLAAGPASRSGLIAQLEFEGYPARDATWAVDQLDIDWEEEATRSATGYLQTMPFSRDGLVDQLLSEGFTQEQAEHGVTEAGL